MKRRQIGKFLHLDDGAYRTISPRWLRMQMSKKRSTPDGFLASCRSRMISARHRPRQSPLRSWQNRSLVIRLSKDMSTDRDQPAFDVPHHLLTPWYPPRRYRPEHFSWSGFFPVSSREQPWSSHAWRPSPPSGSSHVVSRPWLCESTIISRRRCWTGVISSHAQPKHACA